MNQGSLVRARGTEFMDHKSGAYLICRLDLYDCNVSLAILRPHLNFLSSTAGHQRMTTPQFIFFEAKIRDEAGMYTSHFLA